MPLILHYFSETLLFMTWSLHYNRLNSDWNTNIDILKISAVTDYNIS